jgi:hypothetical protein
MGDVMQEIIGFLYYAGIAAWAALILSAAVLFSASGYWWPTGRYMPDWFETAVE